MIPGVHRLGARLHDYDDHHNGWTVKGLETENAVSVPVRGGSIVCFSSLTPHMTGPNVTDGVRKAYICQCASPSPSPVQPFLSGALSLVPPAGTHRTAWCR